MNSADNLRHCCHKLRQCCHKEETGQYMGKNKKVFKNAAVYSSEEGI